MENNIRKKSNDVKRYQIIDYSFECVNSDSGEIITVYKNGLLFRLNIENVKEEHTFEQFLEGIIYVYHCGMCDGKKELRAQIKELLEF